jgi:hypothetical protein
MGLVDTRHCAMAGRTRRFLSFHIPGHRNLKRKRKEEERDGGREGFYGRG